MLVDAHIHLHGYPEALLPTALARIQSYSIRTLAVSVDLPTYQQSMGIAEASDFILPTFGIHPWHAADNAQLLDTVIPFIEATPVIGEIGLDFHWVEDQATYPLQRQVFEYFLAAARDFNKPVNLHTKGAETEILAYLRRYEIKHALIHWYSGDMATLQALVADGHYFTIGVELLFSEQIRAIAQTVPVEQLLTETDNPGGLPWLCEQHSDKVRGWDPYIMEGYALPDAVVPVYEELADLKGLTIPLLEMVIEENFERYLAGQ